MGSTLFIRPQNNPLGTHKYHFHDVELNNEMGRLDFLWENYMEFFFLRDKEFYRFDLADVMDIDESGRFEHIVRLAIRPAKVFPRSLDRESMELLMGQNVYIATFSRPLRSSPLVLTINLFNWASYARFIELLIEAGVFYRFAEPPPTPSEIEWTIAFKAELKANSQCWLRNQFDKLIKKVPFTKASRRNNRRSNSDKKYKDVCDDDKWKLKLKPDQALNLANDLHILGKWKISAMLSEDYVIIYEDDHYMISSS